MVTLGSYQPRLQTHRYWKEKGLKSLYFMYSHGLTQFARYNQTKLTSRKKWFHGLTHCICDALSMTVILCTHSPQPYFSRSKTISSTTPQPYFAYRDCPCGVASSQALAFSASTFSSPDWSSIDAQPLPWYSGRVAMALNT